MCIVCGVYVRRKYIIGYALHPPIRLVLLCMFFHQLHMFVKRFCSRFSHHCNERRSPTNSNRFFPFYRPNFTFTTTLEVFYLYSFTHTNAHQLLLLQPTLSHHCNSMQQDDDTYEKSHFLHLHDLRKVFCCTK